MVSVVVVVVVAGERAREVVVMVIGRGRWAGEGVKETSLTVGVASPRATLSPWRKTLTCLYGGVDGDLDVLWKGETC